MCCEGRYCAMNLPMMRRVLPRTLKERFRTLARVGLGLDIHFAQSRKFDIQPYEMDAKYSRRLLHFEYLLKEVEDIEGRIVECGVGPGRSIFAFSMITQTVTRPREIWGFDTFEGIPPPTGEDGSANAHKTGWWNHSQRHVVELLKYNGLDESYIHSYLTFVPGEFSESLPAYDGGAIALLHLDVDFYESYKTALEFLYDHVATGGAIAFDEYGSPTWPGATQAVDEFFASRSEEIRKSPVTSLYYVVKSPSDST